MIVQIDEKDRLVREAVQEKFCTGCKATKPVTEFTRDRTSKDQFSYRCRACQSKYDKELRRRSKVQRAPVPAPVVATVNGVQPLSMPKITPHSPRNGEILAAVAMLLELPPADCETIIRMVAAFYGKEGVQL